MVAPAEGCIGKRGDFPEPGGYRPGVLDAIVLLGCRIAPSGKPAAAALRRARRAARAWHDGLAPVIVASGGRRWNGVAETEALRQELIQLGVDPQAIIREWQSLTTLGNAVYSAKLLRARGSQRVGVVTCDWHMRRALASFRLVGLEPAALPAESPPIPAPRRLLRALGERGSWWLTRIAKRGPESG